MIKAGSQHVVSQVSIQMVYPEEPKQSTKQYEGARMEQLAMMQSQGHLPPILWILVASLIKT